MEMTRINSPTKARPHAVVADLAVAEALAAVVADAVAEAEADETIAADAVAVAEADGSNRILYEPQTIQKIYLICVVRAPPL